MESAVLLLRGHHCSQRMQLTFFLPAEAAHCRLTQHCTAASLNVCSLTHCCLPSAGQSCDVPASAHWLCLSFECLCA